MQGFELELFKARVVCVRSTKLRERLPEIGECFGRVDPWVKGGLRRRPLERAQGHAG